jgi:large subunit ribosomal protein L22
MQVSAKLKNLRVSQRKTRLVADLVRGKNIDVARVQLQFSTKKTSENILCLLNSAVANAKNNFNLDENNLYIQSIIVEEGPTLKRFMPRAMGRASAIRKRTCSVIIILDETKNRPEKPAKASRKAKKSEKIAEVKDVAKVDPVVVEKAEAVEAKAK